uniref:MULE transposase domain-containing protein n=1 Tax=Schizaphis graminum TaxID=13262 RepID=A0A2S2PRA7_SCHGA
MSFEQAIIVECDIVNHDHDYFKIQDEAVEPQEQIFPVLPMPNAQPHTYTIVPGTQRGTEIIRDDLGFMYYKNKSTENKIYLACLEKKGCKCRATAAIPSDRENKSIVLSKQHNHLVKPFDLDVPFLRQHITEKALTKTVNSYVPRGIYMESIVNFPEAANNYTFIQCAERMRRLRQGMFPATPQNISEFHDLLKNDENQMFTLTLQRLQFYQGPLVVNGVIKGVLFCNIAHIQKIEQNLRNVRVAGCDGTFKTVPKFLDNDAYQIFSFHILFKNVSFPLVHAILTGKTQDIYIELLRYVRTVLPLDYTNLIIITDYEYGLINAAKIVFPESKTQGCYFHFCQAVIRYTRNKKYQIFNLIKTNLNAKCILRMILALPYLPATRINALPSMEDGFDEVIKYVNQFPDLAVQLNDFLIEYVWRYWFLTMSPKNVSVYNQEIRTNNYIESYHASLLRLIKPHPKVWEFLSMV